MDTLPTATTPLITIHPQRPAEEDWRDKPLTRRHMADRYSGKDIAGTQAEKDYFGEDGLQVSDLLDVINPLQHIPFVSTLYRELTGDTISTAAKIAGGALLGGPIGLVASVVDAIFTSETGRDLTQTAVAMVSGDISDPHMGQPKARLASAAPVSEAQIVEQLYPDNAETGPVEIKSLQQKRAADTYASLGASAQPRIDILPPERNAASVAPASSGTMSAAAQSQAMLDLYGASAAPAHRAYRDANMLGYLREASVSAVM